MISEIIREGQNSNEFKPEINAEEYASQIIMIIEGGILLAKTMDDKDFLYLALDRISYIIEKEIKLNS